MVKRRTYSAAFKAQVVLVIISGAKSQVEEAPEAQLTPEVAALLEEMLADSLVREIGVTRLALAELLGLATSDLPLDKLAPRAGMVLRRTRLVQKLMVEEFVKQPERKRRAAAGPHPRRGRGRRGGRRR